MCSFQHVLFSACPCFGMQPFWHVLILACASFGMGFSQKFFRNVLYFECAQNVIKTEWSYFWVILMFEINVRRGANQLSLKQASAFIIWHTRRWLHAPLLLLLRSLTASQPPYWPQDWGCSTPRSQRKHARSLQPPTAKLSRPPTIRFLERQI